MKFKLRNVQNISESMKKSDINNMNATCHIFKKEENKLLKAIIIDAQEHKSLILQK